MKRLLTLLVLVLCSCTETFVGKEIARPNNEILPDLTAAFADEEATRTYVENGKYLRWHEDDRITAFYGNTLNRQYKFNGTTGDNSGTFSLVPSGELGTGNALNHIYALYPYSANATISDEGVISLTISDTQTYAENSFGIGANTMVAVTENLEDTFLAFKNACGYLKLKLYNAEGATIKSIEVKGNNGEKLAGEATLTINFGGAPILTMAESATDTVVLDCGEGVALGTTAEEATELWVVLPATTFAEGLTITATDTEGGVFEKSTTNEVIIERNAIQPMAALVAECTPPGPADNEIWYTNGSTTEATTPYQTYYFSANIISNTYDAEKECWVITFDKKITRIGDYAFYNRSSLTSITIPESVTTVGDYAFEGCNSLPIIDNVRYAGSYLIGAVNKSITSCTIVNGTRFIGNYAFYDCNSLTSVIIPDSVTTIGRSAFSGCSSLTSVNIPDSVTTIGDYAFYDCSSLTSVTIPDSVTTIGRSAFYGCSSLTSVTIGNSVTTIGEGAFYGCISLISTTIPDSVTTIGDWAFRDCTGELIINCNIPSSRSSGDIWYGAFYGNKFTTVTIGDSVTRIGSCAFYDCSSLISVTIGDGVTKIGNEAFCGCSSLTSVNIPDSVTTIGDSAFSNCSSLQEFNGKFASEDGRCLIIDGTLISFAAAGLTEYTIPNSVTTIGEGALYKCRSLTSVTIPDGVTAIGDSAFYNCSSLTSITIPDSVTIIEWDAFSDCYSLTSVTIPDSVTAIGAYAFAKCTRLTSIYCKAITPPTTYLVSINGYDEFWGAFDSNASGRKIYVPRESIEAYKSASYWKNYANAIVGYNVETGEEFTYTITLNNAWRKSTSVSNPDSSLYDGVYESYSNYNKDNGAAMMYIDIEGYNEFCFYIRSDAESTYDYVTVSELDSTKQKVSTSGKQNSGTALSNYTKVTYTGIDGGSHRIIVTYRKDGSVNQGSDRGYVLIPKNQ